MEDFIDKRNFREMCSRSIVKGYNVHYTTKEELEAQQLLTRMEEEKRRKMETTMSAAKEIPPAEKETELPSAHYGEREETDPVTKEQIEKILGEREEQLLEIIQDSST